MPDFFLRQYARAALFLTMLAIFPAQSLSFGNELQKIGTVYATIHYRTEEELAAFTRNIGDSFAFFLTPRRDRRLTAKRVDALVIRVTRLLGMPVLNLRFSVFLYKRQKDLDAHYFTLTGKHPAPVAFYDSKSKNIVVSLACLSKNVLAHEIAHAVICSYFNFPPPLQMQEILAQYVDEHLQE